MMIVRDSRVERTPAAKIAAFMLGLALLAGCFTIPPATNLGPPTPSSSTIRATAWLHDAKITDPEVSGQQGVGEAFTHSLRDYVDQGAYFSSVKMLPGRPGPSDYILTFEFDRFRQSRRYHPLYFPGAFLTATMWIWFGGPIFIDDVDLSGTLTVTRPDGTRVARATAVKSEHVTKNLYSEGYLTSDRTTERTALVADLLGQVSRQLQGGGRS